ncbi:3-hydroxyacyl-CoA dehydrogenase NAD-binding domain-containing protein [Rhodoferax sp.]|uniref:3-hydroxyacyl-CoA dehydrogenase NAD-binding domain-containing protein n=1 Tax=Rhodoferax sp. TaxID=50421 RepID=UPI00378435A3
MQGAAYIQESVLEQAAVKTALLSELQDLVEPGAVIGSSTSGIGASRFTAGLSIATRVLVAHPVNPPHLVPVVELVPSPDTDPAALDFARALMDAVGQSTVVVRQETGGVVLNRLQGALLREAWALVEEGVASCDDIDKTVRDGLADGGASWGPSRPLT